MISVGGAHVHKYNSGDCLQPLFLSIQNVFQFFHQGLMPIGHPDVRNIGSCDIIATWSLFMVTLANPVLFDLGAKALCISSNVKG